MGMTSFMLLLTRHRRSWVVPVFALPSFLIGSFYTGGFLLAGRHNQPEAPLFWLLLFLGAFSIVWWLFGRR